MILDFVEWQSIGIDKMKIHVESNDGWWLMGTLSLYDLDSFIQTRTEELWFYIEIKIELLRDVCKKVGKQDWKKIGLK